MQIIHHKPVVENKYRNLKQILNLNTDFSTPNYSNIGSINNKPTVKYSDLTGLPAKYKHPQT